jgi:8-oxo-dGTP pyrophosphatase MutT (NUDIX family)
VEHGLRHKVVIYLTQGNRLLIFRHTKHPEAGIQVPAGTVMPGEDPDAAAIRETCEETGLDASELKLCGMLGADLRTVQGPQSSEVIRRYFFHLEFTGSSPQTWIHHENDPSDGTPGPIEFEFTWIQFPDDVPLLAGNQGAMLPGLNIGR